jgi:hypothetical protein
LSRILVQIGEVMREGAPVQRVTHVTSTDSAIGVSSSWSVTSSNTLIDRSAPVFGAAAGKDEG